MFTRINNHFDQFGSIATQTPTKRMKRKSTEAAIHEVKTFLVENLSNSLRKTKQQLSIKKTTLWRIVRHSLHFKFYHITSVQPLSEAHKEQCLKFCEWIIAQPADLSRKLSGRMKNSSVCIRRLTPKMKVGVLLKTLLRSSRLII